LPLLEHAGLPLELLLPLPELLLVPLLLPVLLPLPLLLPDPLLLPVCMPPLLELLLPLPLLLLLLLPPPPPLPLLELPELPPLLPLDPPPPPPGIVPIPLCVVGGGLPCLVPPYGPPSGSSAPLQAGTTLTAAPSTSSFRRPSTFASCDILTVPSRDTRLHAAARRCIARVGLPLERLSRRSGVRSYPNHKIVTARERSVTTHHRR
jgi:hypothetical protein